MNFSEYVAEKKPELRCKVCRFLNAYPEEAASIRQEWDRTGKTLAKTLADYLRQTYGELISHHNIADHLRNGHERKSA